MSTATVSHSKQFEANGKQLAKSPAKPPKQYLTNKPLPVPASSLAGADNDTFVHEFARNDIRELIHAITQELKIKGDKTPLVLLAFRPKAENSDLTSFLTQVIPNGNKPAPINIIERVVRNTDEYTLMASLKYLWTRLPMNSIIGWDAYETFKKLEAKADYPKKAFLEFMPQCLTSPAHASIVYDFLDLIVSLSANAKENQMSGRKISKMAGIWAFHGPPNSANLTKSRLDPTENSFREGLKDWLPAADAMFHLLLSFLRSMLPDDHGTKLQLPRTLQALLASNSYPPPDLTYSSSTLVSVPLVTIRSNKMSKSPIELLNKIPKVLRFDNPNVFEAKEDYALLKSLCKNDANILNKLSHESRRIISLMCKRSEETNLHAGWPEYNPPDSQRQSQTTVGISRVSIDDYFIWTWMSSISFEETSAKKKLFGRSLIAEFVFDGFKKWIIVEEQNTESSIRNHEPPLPEKPRSMQQQQQRNVSNPQPHYKSLLSDEPISTAKPRKPKTKVLQESPVPNNIPPPVRKLSSSVSMSPKLNFLKKKFQSGEKATKPLPDPTPQMIQQQRFAEPEQTWDSPEEVAPLPEIETNQYRLSIPLDSFGFDDDYDTSQSNTQQAHYQNPHYQDDPYQTGPYTTGEYQTTAPPRQSNYNQGAPQYFDHDDRYSGEPYQHQYDPQSRDAYSGEFQAPVSPHKSENRVSGSMEDLAHMVNQLSYQVDQVGSKIDGTPRQSPTRERYPQDAYSQDLRHSPKREIPQQQESYQYEHQPQKSNATETSYNSTCSKPRRKPPQSSSSNSLPNNPYDTTRPFQEPAYEELVHQGPAYQEPMYQDSTNYQGEPYQEIVPQPDDARLSKAADPRLSAVKSDVAERDSYYSASQSIDQGQADMSNNTPTTNPTSDDFEDAEDTMVYDSEKRYSEGSQRRYPESIIETYAAPSVHQSNNSEMGSNGNSPAKGSNQSPYSNKRYSNPSSSPTKLSKIPEPLSVNDVNYIPEPTVDSEIPIPSPSPPRSPLKTSSSALALPANLQPPSISPVRSKEQPGYRGSNSSLHLSADSVVSGDPRRGHSPDARSYNSDPRRGPSPDARSYNSQNSDDRARPGYSQQHSQTPQESRNNVRSHDGSLHPQQNSGQNLTTPQRQRVSPQNDGYNSQNASPYRASPTGQQPMYKSPNHPRQQGPPSGNQMTPPSRSNMTNSGPPSSYATPASSSSLLVPQSSRPPRQRSPNSRPPHSNCSVPPPGSVRGASASPGPGMRQKNRSQPPPQGYQHQPAYYPPPQGYYQPPPQQQGYAPQGYPPQGYPPQGYVPQGGYYPPPQGYYPPPQGYYPPPQGYYPPHPQGHGAPQQSAASDLAIGNLPTTGAHNKLHRVGYKNDKKNLRNALTQGDFGI